MTGTASTSGRFKKLLNWGLMIFAYAVGQGALFLSQTWLIVHEQISLLAEFGTAFSFAILFVIVADFGFLTVLSKETAQVVQNDNRDRFIAQNYWRATFCRIPVALVLVVAALLIASLVGEGFFRQYALFAAPSLLLWSFNGAGVLDGLRLGGLSGLSGLFPYLASAVAVFFVADFDTKLAGSVLGGALSLGYLIAVLVQIGVLRWRGIALPVSMPLRKDIIAALRDGGGSLMTVLPGQLFFRVQLGMSAALFGEAVTALLVYSRQVVSGFVMIGNLLRRIEFPDLVIGMKERPTAMVSEVVLRQLGGSLFGVLAFVLVLGAGVVFKLNFEGSVAAAAAALMVFSFQTVTGSVSQASLQGLMAIGKFSAAAVASTISVAVGILATIALAPALSLTGFALAGMVGHLALLIVCGWWLLETQKQHRLAAQSV